MRSLTETLEAAQRGVAQEPAVRVLVRDKQARFTWVGSGGTANVQSALCTASDGALVIAVLNTSGQVKVRRVTEPSVLDPTGPPGYGWGAWSSDYTLVASGMAWPYGDVALSNNSGVLRLFYVSTDGYIMERESTDNGVTWGSESVARWVTGAGPNYYYKLASAGHNDLWYTHSRPGYRRIYMGEKSGGSWGGWRHVQWLMETGGEYSNCYGLSAQWWPAQNKYAVVASLDRASNGDGRIVAGLWDYATATLSSYQAVAPPGWPLPGISPLWPCLLLTSDALGPLWVLTYIERFVSGAVSWTIPLCLFSRDFAHWSYKIPLGFDVTYCQRLTLGETGSVVYAHNINEAYRLDLWYSGKASMEMTIDQERILRYRIMEWPERGELHIELDNRDGYFDHPGVSGGSAEALRPLAQISLEHGLKTAAGTERIESRPFFFWSGSIVRKSGVSLYRIYAVDGWQVLRMWRSDCAIVWQNKTLRWCIEDLASRVGAFECEFDGSAEWDKTVSYFMIPATEDWRGRHRIRSWGRWLDVWDETVALSPNVSGIVVLQRLLSLVGGLARFGNGDHTHVLYCFIPYQQGESPAPHYTYTDGEVLTAQYVDSFGWPTRVRVTGDNVAYEGQSLELGLACGMDFLQTVYSHHLDTPAECQIVAQGILDDALARAWAGWIKARPNVGLELFDVVQFSDSKAGAGLLNVKRRVNGIITEYEPLQRAAGWVQTIYLEGV